ncbi:type VI secretion system baseplate subunit TssG [Photobacterium sp. J15]|uniref:type VI secretion system baseplate subunit TssG n=1 Tax=Photobacterium sp. J15 TaxID=265901 RepID=UPI000A07130C|nr:type VI secretion system baseplate subunit TssG [Photobacterium sp. J15]
MFTSLACDGWEQEIDMSINQVIAKVDKNDFYHTVNALQRWLVEDLDGMAVGSDALPSNERIRFKVSQHLGFPGTAIETIRKEEVDSGLSRLCCYINFTGLTGPSGALPRYYTELLMERVKLKDTALRDFFDLFNHRLISFYYRAWEKFYYPAQYERQLLGHDSSFDKILRSLTGANQDLDVYFGGLFSQQIRNTQGLKQFLEVLSGCEIKITEFVGRWITLKQSEQTCLGSLCQPEGQHARLGISTVLGSRVWDVSSEINIEIKGADPSQCIELMGDGPLFQSMKRIVSHYVPASVEVKWFLITIYRCLPSADLSKHGPGLGRGASLMIRRCLMDKELSIPVC